MRIKPEWFVFGVSQQLLDLMHTLHTRAATIFSSWAEEEKSRQLDQQDKEGFYLDTEGAGEQGEGGISAETSTLWIKCWCPLLQGETGGCSHENTEE